MTRRNRDGISALGNSGRVRLHHGQYLLSGIVWQNDGSNLHPRKIHLSSSSFTN
jgi:hypothetical protein